jgi:hypothetical protein
VPSAVYDSIDVRIRAELAHLYEPDDVQAWMVLP